MENTTITNSDSTISQSTRTQLSNQNVQDPVAPRQQNIWKTFTILLAILLVGTGGYIVYLLNSLNAKVVSQQQTLEASTLPVPTFVSDPTADWKTYTNTKFGFSFKYPKDLSYIYDQSDQYSETGINNAMILLQNFDDSKPRTETDQDFQIVIYIANKNGNFNLEDPQGEQTETTINGVRVIRASTTQKWVSVPTVFFQSSPNKIAVQLSNPNSTNKTWFDQILSTFKFTDNTTLIPNSILNLFDAINTNFGTDLLPISDDQFYSPTGMIVKKSWKLDLLNNSKVNGKAFATFIRSQLTPNDSESSGIGGGGIDAYENSFIKCFHSYLLQGPDTHNYFSCALK